MQERTTAKNGLYMGVGIGLVLFALLGFIPGLLLGGVVGLKIITVMYEVPMTVEVLPKIILAVSMLVGIALAAVVYVIAPGLIGWSIGAIVERVRNAAMARNRETVVQIQK